MSHILDEELHQALMAIAACPTAACHESHVRACLLERLDGLPHVATRVDEFGNLHASYEHEPCGEYRSQMSEDYLKEQGYRLRWKVESYMSALKRTTGSTLLARKPANLLKEAAFKVPAYALNR